MINDKELTDLIDLVSYMRLASYVRMSVDNQSKIVALLKELKERRESDLIPATKFLDQPLSELVRKVMEECDEVVDASDDEMDLYLEEGRIENFKHLLEELADVQFAAETAITKILPKVEARWALRRQVREKNDKRGYYEVVK